MIKKHTIIGEVGYQMQKIKAVFFDMDGTLIRYENSKFHSSWEAIAEALDVSKEWRKALEYYLPKKHLYKEWYEKQTKTLKGVSVKRISDKIFPIPYAPGIREISPYLTSKYKTGIITSGANIVAQKVREELSFDFCLCNELEIIDGKLTGNTVSFLNLWGKGKVFLDICEKLKIYPKNVCFIGDHLNDVPVFKLAGLSIAFNPKENEVAENTDYIINDFRELKRIL